jgi:hypothetical protein
MIGCTRGAPGSTRRGIEPRSSRDGRGLGESCCAARTAAYLLADCAEQSRCAERSTWQSSSAERSRSHGSWLRCWHCGGADASGAGASSWRWLSCENALAAAVLLAAGQHRRLGAGSGLSTAPGNDCGELSEFGFSVSQSVQSSPVLGHRNPPIEWSQ